MEYAEQEAVAKDGLLPPKTVSKKVLQGSIFSRQLHVACKKPCNNGWMSALEEEIGPVLERLVRSRPGIFTASGQLLLATWLAKTTMVAEFVKPDAVTISAQHRLLMKEKQRIPPGWKMWIGTTTGSKYRGAIEHISSHGVELLDPPRPPIPLGDAQVTFFGLNTFLAVVFSSSAAVINPNLQGSWASGLHQIWPIVTEAMAVPFFPLRDEEVDAALAGFRGILHPTMVSPAFAPRFPKRF